MALKDVKPLGWLLIFGAAGATYWFGIKPHLPTAVPTMNIGGHSIGGSSGSDIIVLTTKTKQVWMQKEIDGFNAQSSAKASLDLIESRDSMQAILNGKIKPAVWSPSSPVWVYRLADIFPSGHIDVNSASGYKELFKSPLVFMVNKAKLEALKPILSSPHPFDKIRQINASGIKIRFGYADPLNASSGMLTMSLLLNEYSDTHGGGDPGKFSASPGFASWLGAVDRGLVRSDTEGSSKLEQAFEADPTSRDFITAYENAALTAAQNNPNIALVYPSPTANAEQTAVLVAGPWLSDEQKQTATAFLRFISSPQALSDGLDSDFRPEGPRGGSSLQDHLPAEIKSEYRLSYTSLEPQTYDALNEAASVWHNITH